jgi:two-component system, NtrC family, sensor kinase
MQYQLLNFSGEGHGRRRVTMPNHISKTNPGSPAPSSPAPPGDLQENLRRLDRLANLGLVSASAAHEIKNGLVAINTFLELLLQKGDDPEMNDIVRREFKRIDSLVTQMLRYSATKPAEFKGVCAHTLLDLSLRLLQHQMSGRMISLKRVYQAVPASVYGDESQLQQVFMNMLLNAVEAVGSNGEVVISTENVAGRELKICIRDSGAGIKPEVLSRLFEPFFTTKKNGTGLGLAICRHIVEEHRGRIEVQSEPGQGSTFIVSLPAA